MSLTLDGKIYFVPGVYSVTEIINLGGNALPAFNIGLIIGKHQSLRPYKVGTGSTPALASSFILPYSDLASLENDGGSEGDSEILTFARYAKSLGAGQFFVMGIDPHTQAAVTVQNANSDDAITLTPKKWGAGPNDFTIAIASSVHTITPTKNVTALMANSGTGATISVKNAANYQNQIGKTVYITSNASGYTPQALVIASVDMTVNANKITFTTDITTTALLTDNARIFQDDPDNKEVSTTALTTADAVLAFYASSKIFNVAIVNGATVMPTTLSSTRLAAADGATLGTWVDATSTDWTAVANNFQTWNDQIAGAYKFYIRVVGACVSSYSIHAILNTMAVTMRTNGNPIKVVTGCALGDYSLTTSDSSYPVVRSQTLNTDDILLAGFGLDGMAAYKTFSGEIFGDILGSNVGHNLTHDGIVATTVEKAYGKHDATYLTFIQSGVISIQSTMNGWVVSQGVTTYQDQSTTFNPTTKKTYLSSLRDLADFDNLAINQALDELVGADGITAGTVSLVANDVGNKMIQQGIVLTATVQSVVKSGNGWILTRQTDIGSPTDFIGVITQIIVN